MKKILAFLSMGLFAYTISVYQSCRRSETNCILLQNVNMTAFNSSTGMALKEADSLTAPHLQINIALATKEFSCKQINNISFINGAYAADATANLYYDTLKNITISCLQPFDNAHPPGTPLNAYFGIPGSLQAGNEYRKNYSFSLQTAPDTAMHYQFRVSVQFSGGSLFDTIFPPVKILL